jgi:hypothetical protein
MNFQMFLLVFLLIFSLARLGALCWPHHGLVHSKAEASVRTTLHRLLKPRTPDDCPPVDAPPLPRWVEDQYLLLYAPGAR